MLNVLNKNPKIEGLNQSVNRTKKWLSKITSFIIYGLLIATVLMAVSLKVTGGTPQLFGHEFLTVLSGSMEPGIQTGSIISVSPVKKPIVFKKGDVITFRAKDAPNTLITHRIIEVQQADSSVQYITKGDNNDSRDTLPVPAANIVAQYDHFTIPYLGYLLTFVKSKIGAVITLIFPGALLVGWSIISIWKTISAIDSKEKDSKSLKIG